MSNPTITIITSSNGGHRWIADSAEEVAHFSLPGQGHKIETYTRVATTEAAAVAATVPHEKLTHEIDMVLTDPDTKLSPGAVRALQWCRTWVSVPLQLAQAPVAGQPAEPSPASPQAEALRLAHCFDQPIPPEWSDMVAAAAELRRMHAALSAQPLVADSTLWAVNVHGPDDLYAMPSRAAALEHANELNVYFGEHTGKHEYDPVMRAVAFPWEGSAESHAEDLRSRLAAPKGDSNG